MHIPDIHPNANETDRNWGRGKLSLAIQGPISKYSSNGAANEIIKQTVHQNTEAK
jgi:hypothetical protein